MNKTTLTTVLAAAAFASTASSAQAACAGADDPPGADLDRVAVTTRCLINEERADRGLPPVAPASVLARAARRHSSDMVARQYFEHFTPAGRGVVDRLRAVDYIPTRRAWKVGEILAWGTQGLATPAATVQAWLDSPPHRVVMLTRDYRQMGVGVVLGRPTGRDGAGATYTVDFGKR